MAGGDSAQNSHQMTISRGPQLRTRMCRSSYAHGDMVPSVVDSLVRQQCHAAFVAMSETAGGKVG